MLQAMRSRRYQKYGYYSASRQVSEAGAVASLDATACGRLNIVLEANGMRKWFSIQSSRRKSDSQVRSHVDPGKARCMFSFPLVARCNKLGFWLAFDFFLACALHRCM